MGRRTDAALMRKPPKYCHGYIDCRDKPRWYLRRPGLKQVPLPGLPWSPEFMAAYEAAMAGEKITPGKGAIKPGSVADLITIYYQTAAFTRLSDATRQTYRGILERFRAEYGDYSVARLEEQHVTAILDKMAATPAAANNLRRMPRAIMKLAKKRKMIRAQFDDRGGSLILLQGEGLQGLVGRRNQAVHRLLRHRHARAPGL